MHPRAVAITAFLAALATSYSRAAENSSAPAADAVASIKAALDEERYIDAERLLGQAASAGTKDSRLAILSGELGLARGQNSAALANFQSVEKDRGVRADALQGEGIALAKLGRSAEAMTALKSAVSDNPAAWRAWNALGSEYDKRRAWPDAAAAYDHALTASNSTAIVLNNRGFSRLLQRRLDDATEDFLAALKAKPDLAPARTNLRLALAMKGEYDRAVANNGEDGRAVWLNNAGVAAMLRGDLTEAETFFDQAIKTKGTDYARAEANLQIVRNLLKQDRADPAPTSAAVSH